MLLAKAIRKSCEGSSMKALPRIMKSPTKIQRTLWVLALLVGMVAAIYQLAKLMLGYLEFATSVNIVTEREAPPFPDVTICHLDPDWTFRVLENELHEDISMAHYMARVQKLQQMYKTGSKEYEYLKVLAEFAGYLQNTPHIHSAVNKLRDIFIIDCRAFPGWENKPCFSGEINYVNTSMFLDPFYGLCVTFQSNSDALKGLNVILYLDDPEVVVPQKFDMGDDALTHTSLVGARVVVHPPNSFPDIWLTSQHVHAGVDMAFKLEGTRRTLLDDPFGSCITRDEAEAAQRDGVTGYAINRHGYECYRMCAKDHILKDCGCINMFYSTTKEERATTALCGYIDEKNISATFARLDCAGITEAYLNKDFQTICSCPIPCEQFTYEYSTKSIQWPHNTYHLSFYEQYIKNKSYTAKFFEYENILNISQYNEEEAVRKVGHLDGIHDNFAQVRVLNHQKSYFHYSETPLISPEALFGNVGGLLNLWVGITFITIIEIVEFVHQLCSSKTQDSEKKLQNGKGKHIATATDPSADELLRKA